MRRQELILTALILTLVSAAPAAATLTVYTDRAAWEAALGGNVVTEDWTGDPVGDYATPYITAEGTIFTALSGSPITLQIVDGDHVDEVRELHFRDFAAGVGVTLPNNGRGFGFDYDTAVEPWSVTAGGRTTLLLPHINGFVGYVDDSGPLTSFTLKGASGAQGGISLDNLSRAGVRFGGLPHAALGQARLSDAPDGSLMVSNLGPSGNDGVSIHLGQVEAFTTNTVLKPAETPIGAIMQTQTLGSVDGQPGRPMGRLGLARTTDGYTALVDYSDLGA